MVMSISGVGPVGDKVAIKPTHVQDDLVKELHGVTTEHHRHDAPVDLAPKAPQLSLSGMHILHPTIGIQELPRRVDIGHLGLRAVAGNRRTHSLLEASFFVRHSC